VDIATTDNRELVGTKRIEGWLTAHVELIAMVAVAAGLGIRLYHVLGTYLNPDEALHFMSANRLTLFETYQSSLYTAHPPLFLLVMHLALMLGRSETVLRLPSVIAGTAALWFVFRWLQRSAGAAAALVGVALLACSPAMIATGMEARQYGLLEGFVCAALYSMERAFSERSRLWVVVFAASLYGAILSHYTAVWVTLALGLYVLVRGWFERPPRALVTAWGVSQLGAAALYGWLYAVHLSTMRGGGVETGAMSGWLKYQYYRPGEERLVDFIWRALSGVFTLAAGGPRLAAIAALLFVVGVAMIVLSGPRSPHPIRRDYAVLLVLPLLLGLTGAIERLLPFGSTRHASYMLPFIAAGAAVGVARVLREKLALVMLATVAVAPLWLSRTEPANAVAGMPSDDLRAALAYLDAVVGDDAVVFVDGQTHLLLGYYLQRDLNGLRVRGRGSVNDTQLGRFRIVSMQQSWTFSQDDVVRDAVTVAQTLDLPRGAPLWLMTMGWSTGEGIAQRLPPNAVVTVRRFGHISVVQTAVGFLGASS
jgi:dolichyl-phosphate-mannose-protein mannosyltransferase